MKTKSLLFTLTILCLMNANLSCHAQNPSEQKSGKTRILIAYFSATGTTARTASQLARICGGDLYEIRPEKPYSEADLDWHDSQSRSSVEMNDPRSRPAIVKTEIDMTAYDTVLIGYPVWWNLAPRVIYTFIESHDWKGKTLMPFATSGSSGISGSAADLKKNYPELDWKEGRLLNRLSEKTVSEWLGNL